ncbi:MAG: molecular chaperone HtpG [Verrucomicrobiales bacterium]|nr:molecular chaperone HtpG [Verrucomicrobiales bacterium]
MSQKEHHTFQAEIQRVLDIVIHSLYTEREIFLRELVSNAADALEKLRFLQTSGQTLHQPELPLEITVVADSAAGTLTLTDTGIGMTRDELVENLGTIAHSGSKAFLQKLAEAKEKPAVNLIGQFGVGFYSAFMVATQVEVFTRSHQPDGEGWHWVSDGAGGYDIEPGEALPRGTRIVLHLKDDAKEFAENWQLEQTLKRYSSFVPFPIKVSDKVLNTVQALWARSKSEIKEEEYKEFYEFIGHDPEPPLARLHFNADAPLAIQALLFVPARNLENMGLGKSESEVNLHCRKVLIQSKAKGLFPDWLRFLKGVVDSEDLPLNISRETMQDSALLGKLNRVLTGRFLKFLAELSEKDAAVYEKIYATHSRFLKEGTITDYEHREALSKLLRFESTFTAAGQTTTLAEYVKRMKEGQKEIYHIHAAHRAAAAASPYLEGPRELGYEVLFSFEPVDEFVFEHLREFDGKPLKPAEKADLKIERAAEGALSDDAARDLAAFVKETLGARVNQVRASQRLVGSPAVVIDSDEMVTSSMRRLMKAMKREDGPEAEPGKLDLELNPGHTVVVGLDRLRRTDAVLAATVAEHLFDSARLSAGVLDEPQVLLRRMNELLERVVAKAP